MNELSSLLGYLDNVRFDVDGVDIRVWEEDYSGSFSVMSHSSRSMPFLYFLIFNLFGHYQYHIRFKYSRGCGLG